METQTIKLIIAQQAVGIRLTSSEKIVNGSLHHWMEIMCASICCMCSIMCHPVLGQQSGQALGRSSTSTHHYQSTTGSRAIAQNVHGA